MKRNVFGVFAIASGLAVWATIGAAAQGTTAPATFDPTTCPAQDQLQLQQSLTGVNSAEATAELQELNAEASLAQAEITAEANDALAELASEGADEAGDEDGTSTMTLDAKILAIKTAACQALGNLVTEYKAAVADLTTEFTQPKPETQDVENETERHDAERDAPETEQRTSGGDD